MFALLVADTDDPTQIRLGHAGDETSTAISASAFDLSPGITVFVGEPPSATAIAVFMPLAALELCNQDIVVGKPCHNANVESAAVSIAVTTGDDIADVDFSAQAIMKYGVAQCFPFNCITR